MTAIGVTAASITGPTNAAAVQTARRESEICHTIDDEYGSFHVAKSAESVGSDTMQRRSFSLSFIYDSFATSRH
ncbi:hypothetical protein ACFYXQ_06720 [Nocardia jiangxiensis]|uniref:Secreted protein n=1 Tax=Nocardia jiangxiensis TaxID=282685 RepID=A0ABW6RTW2_9NOCA